MDCMLEDRGEYLLTEWGTVRCDHGGPLVMRIPIFKEPTPRLENYLLHQIMTTDQSSGIATKYGRIIFDRDWGNNTLTFRLHY